MASETSEDNNSYPWSQHESQEQEQDQEGQDESEESSSTSNITTEDNDDVEDDFDSTELSSESVMAFAGTVGVTLTEDVAGLLGDLTMRKLRHAVVSALEFADREGGSGLKTSHFGKVEELLNMRSYGHQSNLPPPVFRPIEEGNFSILDDGPELDLYAMLDNTPNEIRLQSADPEFHVQEVLLNSRLLDIIGDSSSDEEEEEEEVSPDGDEDDVENAEEADITATEPEAESEEHLNNHDDDDPVANHVEPFQNGVEEEQEDLEEAATPTSTSNSVISDESDVTFTTECRQYLHLNEEWKDFMELLLTCIIGETNGTSTGDSDSNIDLDMEFECILEDLRKHGAAPVADIICDLFCDVINGKFSAVSSTSLKNVVLTIGALMEGSSSLPTVLKRKLSSILIEVLILPPECELQELLISVFMKMLEQYDELLTWTCTYVTEVLKRTAEIPVDDISYEYKSLLYGALLLANKLEVVNIKVAHEFGWDTSISCLRNNRLAIKDKDETDGFLEAELTMFEKSHPHS